jgi:hypothetical protein
MSREARPYATLRTAPGTDNLLPWAQAEAVLEAAKADPDKTGFGHYVYLYLVRRLSLSTGQVQRLNVDSYDRRTKKLLTKQRLGAGIQERDASGVAEVLEKWLDERATDPFYSFKRSDPALFIGRQGRLSTRYVRGWTKAYGKAAGLGMEVHPDALRQKVPIDHPSFNWSTFAELGTPSTPPGAVWSPQPLQPFREKADDDYTVQILGGPKVRTREHETLINDFAHWLKFTHGLEPMRNAVIDLALSDPPVIVEAKHVPGPEAWPQAIREAVSQLYEYRFFGVANPKWSLLFLASNRVEDKWVRYLEQDRRIAVTWRSLDGFELTGMAATALRIMGD